MLPLASTMTLVASGYCTSWSMPLHGRLAEAKMGLYAEEHILPLPSGSSLFSSSLRRRRVRGEGRAHSDLRGGVDSSAEGVYSPAEGVDSPAEGINSPAEGVHSPAEGINSPAKGVHSPSEGVHSPSEG
eukprot:1176240-Prorocentrum_minimum.AAC.2